MATCPDGHESAATDYCDICGKRMGSLSSSAAGSTPAGGSAPAAPAHAGTETAGPSGRAHETCSNCGAERTGQFCEACGLDFSSGAVPPARQAASITSLSPDQAKPESQSPPPVPAQAEPQSQSSSPAAAQAEQPSQSSTPAAAQAEQPPQPSPPVAAQTWTAVATADRNYFDQVVGHGGPDAGTIEFPAYCPERRFRLIGPQMRIGRRSASRGIEPEIDLTGPPADTGVSHMHAVLIAEPDGTWALVDPGSANGTQLNGAEIATGVKVPLHDGDRISLGGWTVLTIQAG